MIVRYASAVAYGQTVSPQAFLLGSASVSGPGGVTVL